MIRAVSPIDRSDVVRYALWLRRSPWLYVNGPESTH